MPVRPLLLFDLDGCLVDSSQAITEAIREGLGGLGIEVPAATSLTWCIGPPLRESLARLLSELEADPALLPTSMDAYREVYAATWRQRTLVFEGIEATLDALAADATLGVVTSKPAPIAEPILADLGLRERFTAVHAPEADHRAEPKTTTLRRALAALSAGAPDGVVMIGDREHDVLAGRACGTATIGVTWGAGDRDELIAAGADAIADAPAELVSLAGPGRDDGRAETPR